MMNGVPRGSTAQRPNSDRWTSPWLGLVPIGVVFCLAAWWSWRKWPDVLIDFGLQLYIPWKISEGSRLYHDIMYLPGGPLSQHFNALLFKCFGPSFTVLIVSNLLLFGLLVALVYRCFVKATNRLVATVIGFVLVIGFGFEHYVEFGNYNYVCPYAHEIFHGLVLSVALLALLSRGFRNASTGRIFAAGVCFGAIFLTKPEVFLAATVVVGATFLLEVIADRAALRVLVTRLAIFAFSSALPLFTFFAYFLSYDTAASSLKSVCWAWVPLLTSNVSKSEFYRNLLGFDAPLRHSLLMVVHFLVLATGVAVLVCRAPSARRYGVERIILLVLAGAGSLYFEWMESGRSLPLIALTTLAIFGWKHRNDLLERRPEFLFPALWTLFGLVLLAKMGFHSHIWHYGAFLAMPGFIGAIYLLLWLLPESFPRIAPLRREFCGPVLAFLAFGVIRLTVQSHLYYTDKNFPIGQGGDRVIAYDPREDNRGQMIKEAADWVEANVPAGKTFAAIPEGALINYLTRRTNPTPYPVFMAEMFAFGENRMIDAYREHSPDYIALINRITQDYGADYFGQRKGFGKDTVDWIHAHYEPIHLIGAEPLQSELFGIQFFRRKLPHAESK